ncbi:MAG: YifB family Mg chelatase-like AAA ATPase [Clostridiales Family XIII bacterium]|jgi:magnesium chelatase family protein|nr:YifB family Mg chelatase-like AAA ATPase [Clostridiales Family XIII bacterium]
MPALSIISSASLSGIEAASVNVETDISPGLPNIFLVGLPGNAVRESRERIRSAISNSGFEFPMRRITINLSPAATRKEGSHFDLPIAIAVLSASGKAKMDKERLEKGIFFGELSLDGAVRRIEAAAALVIGRYEAGARDVYLPVENMNEVPSLKDLRYHPVSSLSEAVSLLSPGAERNTFAFKHERESLPDVKGPGVEEAGDRREDDIRDVYRSDYSEVLGQERTKRALTIAAAGRHDILLVGPPGVGKSMMAGMFADILPPLTETESMEVTRIHSIAGLSGGHELIKKRPFRAPHHSSTMTAIIGGGHNRVMPGEVSLAHRGTLFLDELPEFNRQALDMLRQPMENRYVDLSRTGFKERMPCDFLFIAAMNPCPCGHFGDPLHACICPESSIDRYRAKVSGPLMDRIDIHVTMDHIPSGDAALFAKKERNGLSTEEMKKSVEDAISFRKERVDGDLRFSDEAASMLDNAYSKYGLSMRSRSKLINVARTIADLEASAEVLPVHVGEALSFRREQR